MSANVRCGCNSGECSKCLLDLIDQDLIDRPDFRHCTCGSKLCAVCNYYTEIETRPKACTCRTGGWFDFQGVCINCGGLKHAKD